MGRMVLVLFVVGCASGSREPGPFGDGGAVRRDSGAMRVDSGPRTDGGSMGFDAGPPGVDAGPACDPSDCDDGNLCTAESCATGACMSMPMSCDDGSACTMDSCAPSSGCANTPVTVMGATCMMTIEASAGGIFRGDSTCAGNDDTGGCGAGDAPDVVFRITLASGSNITLDASGTSYDSVLSLSTMCGAEDLGCDDEGAGGGAARLAVTGLGAGTYYAILDGKDGGTGGMWQVNVAITPSDVVLNFPLAGDFASPDHGYLWSAGSYIEGSRTTTLPSVRQAVVHLVVTENLLTCDTQDMRLRINGAIAGSFSLSSATRTLDTTFSFGAITGPTYILRYENARPVSGGCGSVNFLPATTGGSTITLRP